MRTLLHFFTLPVIGLTFSLGMVLDMSTGLIMAGTPPRKATAVLTSLKLFFSFSSSFLKTSDGESESVWKRKKDNVIYISHI